MGFFMVTQKSCCLWCNWFCMLLLKGLNNVQDLFLNVRVVSHPWLFWDSVNLHGKQDSSSLWQSLAIHSNRRKKLLWNSQIFYSLLQVKALPRLEKSALLENALSTLVQKKDIFLYIDHTDNTGLVQSRAWVDGKAKQDKAKVSFIMALAKGKNAPAFPVHLNAIVRLYCLALR